MKYTSNLRVKEMIKKQFEAIHALLEANKNKKVSTIMADLEALMTSKVQQKTFELDDEGNVTRVFCYYHKQWEDVAEVPYGKKASTASGLNTMCKEGLSNWTKQQRAYKKAKEQLLDQLSSGEVLQEELSEHLQTLEEQKDVIIPLTTAE